ncbi:MAG: hypothetical protein JWO46_1799 [Nocardioidaceae bacterium]|nr:hypothetical protein [Nocardioidaceae bacterium]
MTAPTVVWHLADLYSGDLITPLPIAASDKTRRTLAEDIQVQHTLKAFDRNCPTNWGEIVTPGRTMLVQTNDGDVVQGWPVIDRRRGDADGNIPLECHTLEHCMSRENVPDIDGDWDSALLVAELADALIARFNFIIDATPSGATLVDQNYSSYTDQDVLSACTDLMGQAGGPEWRILVRWRPDRSGFEKVLQVAARIGEERPDTVFRLDENGRGNVGTYDIADSFARGQGATMLIGADDGTGPSGRTMSAPVFATDEIAEGYPIWEERKIFTNLGDADDLLTQITGLTEGLLPARARGSINGTLTVNDGDSPQAGRDYFEGDTVFVDIAPQGQICSDGTFRYSDPDGWQAKVRVRGFDVDPVTGLANPTLWENPDDAG